MAKKQKQEQIQNLPALGCEACLGESGFAPGWIIRQENGINTVRMCQCKRNRERARAGLAPPSPQHDSKAKAAGE